MHKSPITSDSVSYDEILRPPRIRSAAFFGRNLAWLAPLEGGHLLFTEDGGANWRKVPAPELSSYSCISFIDAHRGWAVSNTQRKGRVWRTEDGGRTWSIISFLESGHPGWSFGLPSKIVFTDQLHGWIVETYTTWYTFDGGVNWTEVTPPAMKRRAQPVCWFFLNSLQGWICSSNGPLFFTADSGKTWQSQDFPSLNLQDVTFVDEKTGWVNGKELYNTIDGGKSWQAQTNLPKDIDLESIYFLSKEEGWAIGRKFIGHHRAGQSIDVEKSFRGIVLHTTNGGQSWQPVRIGKDEPFFDQIYFTDVEHGWLLSRDNVYRTNDRGRTWQMVLNVPSIMSQ
jgi:photosystem II stability/assembly factor-like uncharacterized protein